MTDNRVEADQSSKKMIAFKSPQSSISEHFRSLRTNINFLSLKEEPFRSIVITSASPSEGKSTTAANLAIVFAQEGKKVLLVDGDIRKPTLHTTFLNESSAGLTELLLEKASLQAVIQSTEVKNLYLLPSGSIPSNPLELLGSETMAKLVNHLQGIYDLILVDTPPILLVADGKILASKCDGAILVVKSGVTDKNLALRAKEEILLSNSKLIGVVLNDFRKS